MAETVEGRQVFARGFSGAIAFSLKLSALEGIGTGGVYWSEGAGFEGVSGGVTSSEGYLWSAARPPSPSTKRICVLYFSAPPRLATYLFTLRRQAVYTSI